jgi:uncharacterized phiE125 gp8 family phage protein
MYGPPAILSPQYLAPPGLTFAQVRWRLALLSPPAREPVTITEAKQLGKVEFNDDDRLWTPWVINARKQIEADTARAFISQTWRLYLDQFPTWDIDLRRCPVQSIESITFVDPSGVLQTHPVDSYMLDAVSEPARVTPAWGKAWPATRLQPNAITITFLAGYGDDPDDVPEFCKEPIKTLTVFWNEHRQLSGQKPPNYELLITTLKWGDYQ